MSAELNIEYVSVERVIPMRRVWAMPDSETFSIPPIEGLIRPYLRSSSLSVDPFARNKRWATHTNDLSVATTAEHHLEAAEFLQMLATQGVVVDLAFFDPPYSLRQCAEVYESVGRPVTQRDTQVFGRWTEHKEILTKIIAPNGIVISFGWNSQGMGLQNGFEIKEMLIVCHGGAHNDTIVTVERKVENAQTDLFTP